MGMLIKNIQSHKVRAVITGNATPASDLIAMWPQLSKAERLEATSYFGSLSALLETRASGACLLYCPRRMNNFKTRPIFCKHEN